MISKMLFFTKSRILSSEAGFCCHSGRKMLKRVCNTVGSVAGCWGGGVGGLLGTAGSVVMPATGGEWDRKRVRDVGEREERGVK